MAYVVALELEGCIGIGTITCPTFSFAACLVHSSTAAWTEGVYGVLAKTCERSTSYV